MRFLNKVINKLTLRTYRDTLLLEQRKNKEEMRRLFKQVFLINPVLLVDNVKMYLPLFYVDHIQKAIFQTRNFYELETLEFLRLHYKQFKQIVDIGSNIGNHMLYYCSSLKADKVYCFEPNNVSLEALNRNVAINSLERTVKIYPFALGKGNGKGMQKDFSLSNTGMNKVRLLDEGEFCESPIDICSLDSFQLQEIDFIKIDVEGFELEVLLGAMETIRKSKPVLLVESFEANQRAVDRFLEEMGYQKLITFKEFDSLYVPS